jgi:flagellar L-ring protein precursor FlgH
MNPARVIFLTGVLATGCAVRHIDEYKPKQRTYEPPPVSAVSQAPAAAEGSLWRDDRPAAKLFADARALHENDLVVVKVEESAAAQRSSDMDYQRESANAANVSAFLSSLTTTPSAEFSASGSNKFRGQGSTARTEKLTATVPALVRKVLPNGNLFIEGHRVVLVNNEEAHFYVSGVVRPFDIDQENSVKSSMVADAEIEFTGRGAMTDNQQQGIIQRFFGWIWPF